MAPSEEVTAANGLEGLTLEEQLGEARRIAATPTDKEVAAARAAELERQIAERDAAALKSEAKRRLLGIAQAHGSLAGELEEDDVRALVAAREYADAMRTLDARFQKLSLLRHEARALAEAFGLEVPDLSTVVLPGHREALREALQIVGSVPVRDTGYVHEERDFGTKRRTYAELADTKGYKLLAALPEQQAAAAPKAPAADEARVGT